MDIERKNFDTSIKIDPDGTIEAIVSVFSNQDRGAEVVKHGAFTKSLARKMPKGVWSHDWSQPVAKTIEARELSPGDPLLPGSISALGGLYVKGQFNLDTEAGRDTYSNIKFGIIDEFSIGYRVVTDSIDEKSNVRELHEVELYEWSPVLVGMNSATQLLSIKSDDGAPALRLAEHSEAVLATCKEFAVRIQSLRDLRAKEGRVISSANRGRIQSCVDSMQTCMDGLTEMMNMSDPMPKASDADVRRIHADVLKTILALQGVA